MAIGNRSLRCLPLLDCSPAFHPKTSEAGNLRRHVHRRPQNVPRVFHSASVVHSGIRFSFPYSLREPGKRIWCVCVNHFLCDAGNGEIAISNYYSMKFK